MKILVISDSHGRTERLLRAISYHPDAEYVLFLGDGHCDFDVAADRHRDKIFYAVRGNNDWSCDEPYVRIIELCGWRIMMLHGHTAGVKHGISNLLQSAAENGCDAVLFGHTHQPLERTEYVGDRRIYLFNPGSCAFGERTDTYGIITLDEKNILFSVGDIK